MSIGEDKSPMTSRVCSLLESFNNPSGSYLIILSNFDDTLSYVNDMLIYVSSEAEKSKFLWLDAQKHLESKGSRIDSLELQLNNITLDRELITTNNVIIMKQKNIHYNSAKRMYAKSTILHHSSEICK